MLFLLVWRRNGVAVPAVIIGALLLFNIAFGKSYEEHIGPKIFAALFAAAVIFAIARFTEEDGDHFFFVPLKFWAPIVAIVGTIIAVGIGETHAKPTETAEQQQTQPAQPAPQPMPVQEAAIAPVPQPQPQPKPKPAVQAEEPVMQVAQVYVDPATKLYYPERCASRPESATRLAKSVAVMQGYAPAPGCGS